MNAIHTHTHTHTDRLVRFGNDQAAYTLKFPGLRISLAGRTRPYTLVECTSCGDVRKVR